MELRWSERNGVSFYESVEGVTILPVGYMGSGVAGGTDGSDFIIDIEGYGFGYFSDIINQLENALGYKKGKNLFSVCAFILLHLP
jgi:hypothetical protein